MKILLVLALAFSFVACNKQASTDAPAESVEAAAPAEAAPEVAPAEAAPEAAPAEAAPAAEGEAN